VRRSWKFRGIAQRQFAVACLTSWKPPILTISTPFTHCRYVCFPATWDEASCWDPAVPSACSIASIPSGSWISWSTAANASCSSFSISSTATLQLTAPNTFTVLGPSASSVATSGSLLLDAPSGTLSIAASSGAVVQVQGQLLWRDGTLVGDSTSSPSVVIQSAGSIYFNSSSGSPVLSALLTIQSTNANNMFQTSSANGLNVTSAGVLSLANGHFSFASGQHQVQSGM
jgi:hypothetical protein